jgi:hypothetical protein
MGHTTTDMSQVCPGISQDGHALMQALASRISPVGYSYRHRSSRLRVAAMASPTAGKPIECLAAVAWEAKKPLDVTTVTVAPPGPGKAARMLASTATFGFA